MAAAPRLAEGEDWGSGKRGGVGTRHATRSNGGEVPPPQRSQGFSGKLPISLRYLCVCECVSGESVREREGASERDGGVRSPDTDSPRGLNWSHLPASFSSSSSSSSSNTSSTPDLHLPTPASSPNHINMLTCTAAKTKPLPPDFSSKGLRQTQKKTTGS